MSETLVITALTIIIAGFLILVGVAIWLAVDRRRNPPGTRAQTRETPAPAPSAPRSERPAAEASAAAPAVPAARQPVHAGETNSAEYSAPIYDQTWLPNQPKRSKRPKTQEPA
jgi:hypothetical protein